MTGVDGLNHVLRVWTVIRSDYGRGFGGLFGENGRRKGKCVEISAFSDCGILEDNQEARIIDPLDLESSADVFPLYKRGLNIPRLQLLRETGERKNPGDASRELGERRGHNGRGSEGVFERDRRKETIEASMAWKTRG